MAYCTLPRTGPSNLLHQFPATTHPKQRKLRVVTL
jgi:hypothetical protein